MKNADLEALLKSRGLPTGGKKADMVDRLVKDDEKAADASASKPAASNPEDEIDWDDDAEEAPVEPTPAAKPAASIADTGIKDQVPNPQAVPNQVADIDPSNTDDLSVKVPTEEKTETQDKNKAEEKKEPTPDYTRGLAATNLEAEIEKRKARAKKFGLNIDEDEGLKKLERAKKFGETGPPKGLDEALSDRTRKRGRDDNEESNKNKRRGGGNDRRGRGNQGDSRGGDRRGERGGDRRRDGRDNRDRGDGRRDDRSRNDGANWMSTEDKAKAEARKNKWATPVAPS